MAHRTSDATVSAHNAVVVVPNNATVIPPTRGLWIGSTGNVAVRMVDRTPPDGDGTTVIWPNVPVGILQAQVDQVLSTGTTASSILALY